MTKNKIFTIIALFISHLSFSQEMAYDAIKDFFSKREPFKERLDFEYKVFNTKSEYDVYYGPKVESEQVNEINIKTITQDHEGVDLYGGIFKSPHKTGFIYYFDEIIGCINFYGFKKEDDLFDRLNRQKLVPIEDIQSNYFSNIFKYRDIFIIYEYDQKLPSTYYIGTAQRPVRVYSNNFKLYSFKKKNDLLNFVTNYNSFRKNEEKIEEDNQKLELFKKSRESNVVDYELYQSSDILRIDSILRISILNYSIEKKKKENFQLTFDLENNPDLNVVTCKSRFCDDYFKKTISKLNFIPVTDSSYPLYPLFTHYKKTFEIKITLNKVSFKIDKKNNIISDLNLSDFENQYIMKSMPEKNPLTLNNYKGTYIADRYKITVGDKTITYIENLEKKSISFWELLFASF